MQRLSKSKGESHHKRSGCNAYFGEGVKCANLESVWDFVVAPVSWDGCTSLASSCFQFIKRIDLERLDFATCKRHRVRVEITRESVLERAGSDCARFGVFGAFNLGLVCVEKVVVFTRGQSGQRSDTICERVDWLGSFGRIRIFRNHEHERILRGFRWVLCVVSERRIGTLVRFRRTVGFYLFFFFF